MHHYHTKSNFDYLVIITNDEFYSTFLRFCEVCYYSFTSTWGTAFTIPLKINQLMMNSFSFCFFGKVFISSSFLKDSFFRYRIFFWWNFYFVCFRQFYFITLYVFNILYISSRFLLTWNIFVEKFSDILMWVPIYEISLCCCFQNIFFVVDFGQLNYHLFQCSPIQV